MSDDEDRAWAIRDDLALAMVNKCASEKLSKAAWVCDDDLVRPQNRWQWRELTAAPVPPEQHQYPQKGPALRFSFGVVLDETGEDQFGVGLAHLRRGHHPAARCAACTTSPSDRPMMHSLVQGASAASDLSSS